MIRLITILSALAALSAGAYEFGTSFPGMNFTVPPFGQAIAVIEGDDVVGNTNRHRRIEATAGLSMLSVLDGVMERQIVPFSQDRMKDSGSGMDFDQSAHPFPSNDLALCDWVDNSASNVYNHLLIDQHYVLEKWAKDRDTRRLMWAGRISRWLPNELEKAWNSMTGCIPQTELYQSVHYGSSLLGGADWFEYDECGVDVAVEKAIEQANELGVWRTFREVPWKVPTTNDFPCYAFEVLDCNDAFPFIDWEDSIENKRSRTYATNQIRRLRERTLPVITNLVSKFPVNVQTNCFPPTTSRFRIDQASWGEAAAVLTLVDKTYHDGYPYNRCFGAKALVHDYSASRAYLVEYEADATVSSLETITSPLEGDRYYAEISIGSSAKVRESERGEVLGGEPHPSLANQISCEVRAEVGNTIACQFEISCSLKSHIDTTIADLSIPDGRYPVTFYETAFGGEYQLIVSIGGYTKEFTSSSRFITAGAIANGTKGKFTQSIAVSEVSKSVPSNIFENVLSPDDDQTSAGNLPIRQPARRFWDAGLIDSISIQHFADYTYEDYSKPWEEGGYTNKMAAAGVKCTVHNVHDECIKFARKDMDKVVGFVDKCTGNRLTLNPVKLQDAFATDEMQAGENEITHGKKWLHEGHIQLVDSVLVSGGSSTLLDVAGNPIKEKTPEGDIVTHKDVFVYSREINKNRIYNAAANISFPYVIKWNFNTFRNPNEYKEQNP